MDDLDAERTQRFRRLTFGVAGHAPQLESAVHQRADNGAALPSGGSGDEHDAIRHLRFPFAAVEV